MSEDEICPAECKIVQGNLQKVISRGREPGLLLDTLRGEVTLTEVGSNLLAEVQMTGKLLDQIHKTDTYSISVDVQIRKLEDPSLTPSAQVLRSLQETGLNYTQWILQKSREHKDTFTDVSLYSEVLKDLTQRARSSLKKQQQIEDGDALNFDQFLEKYLAC